MMTNGKAEKAKQWGSFVSFLEDAAEQSRYHTGHWFRYLRKVITEDGIKLTPEEIDQIIKSDKLTLVQKVSLKQAIKKDTPTNRYVVGLNQRTTTPMLREIMMRNRNV